jgi:acyl-CoA synthetase (AMP-forming)/AMP-acid ligase II
MNIARLLWDTAERMPERIALREDAASTTYAALAARASAFHEAFRAFGLREGDRVGILLPNGVDAAAAFYGTAAAGGIATVISGLARPRQVEQLLADSGARILVTTRALLALQPRELVTPVTLLFAEEVSGASDRGPVTVQGTVPAQISYTSGSTGTPKGVVITHANLRAGIGTVVDYLGITLDDRIASLLPFSFVYGFNQLNCAIATGASLEVIDTTLAPEMVRSIVSRGCSVVAAVPPLWMQMLRVADFASPIPALRVLTCAGGRLNPEGVRAVRAAQPQARLFLMYGLTEVFRSTFLPPEEVDAHPDSMGRAVPGSRVYVLREDGTLCADGEVGELAHAGPTVAAGYWQDADATARVFKTNPFALPDEPALARLVHSGDLVRRDAEGRLYYVGRRDRMIKTLGYRVSPDEVTDVLFASGLVADAALTTEADAQRGERIVAHLVLRDGATLDAVRRWCGAELPRHMQPARWEMHDHLPRNASGKHDLLALARSGRGDES